MLPRVLPALRTVSGVLRQQQSRVLLPSASYGYHAVFKPEHEVAKEVRSSMNDHPVPTGSWQEAYNKTNTQRNIMLAVSILSLVATLFAMKQTGVLYLHTLPNYKKVQIDPTKPIE